ncbi:hypothetical protein PFISCL1PPCAC_15178 [Pristionchus fissidentatus]|uniref:Peptidase n=1 Tax=Pristionchus fissidentatus TaxID=1538716 RepID=A0AAV5VVT3_9BILA|nr:hypothetical protein PFISCL1PPCAC_15178 [Pristionchus fissidentatus]
MLRNSPPFTRGDEVLPCLNIEDKSPCPLHGEQALSDAFSSISTRRKDHCRRFILLFLLLCILILAVFIAFVLGKYISEWHRNVDKPKEDLWRVNQSTPSPSPSSSSLLSSTSPSTPRLTSPTTTRLPPLPPDTTPFHYARLIPLGAVKNSTLDEVFVPFQSTDDEDWAVASHSSELRMQRDTFLVPLSTSITPVQYEIHMDITRFSDLRQITANVSIHLMSYGNSTDEEIVFHAGPEIRIARIRLRSGDHNVSIISMKNETSKKLYRILLKESLKRAEYVLDLEYTTSICESPDGGVNCYFEPTENVTASKVTSFTTKFEPALARTVFQLTVRHSSSLKVLSNTAVQWTKVDGEGESITHFKQTPPMSSYLLALAAGEFVRLEMFTRRKIPLTIWTFPEDLARASFAAQFAPKMFDQQEEELEVLYPLSKLDMVAARSFSVGAMENWGLVVFDSHTLLQQTEIDDSMAMTVDRHHHEYRIAKIITHEIAHQWFGNLVTMRDWSELWLNEGFASFLVYEMLTARYPHLTEFEYYNRLAILFHKQSGVDRPALVRSLSRESQVEAAFHTTHLYTKGCVVVRMIRDLVSAFDFSAGIKRYIRNNAYGAVTRLDLFASLPVYADHGAENERLDEIIETWLLNEGMPEVTVSRKYDTDGIRVTQRLSRANRYRIFLYDEKGGVDPTTFSYTDNSYNSEEGSRVVRSAVEQEKEFDDTLFDDLPIDYRRTTERKRQRHRKKTRSGSKTRESSDIVVEKRAEDNRKKSRHSPSDRWSIPFSYMFGSIKSTEGQVIRQFWLKNRSISFTDVELSPTAPLLANPEWAYPYRVNYDYANWKMITKLLHDNHNEIPLKSRMQLIVDGEFFLSQSGLPHLYIYLLSYLQSEESLGASLLGLDAVHRLIESFQGSPVLPHLIRYLTPVISRLDRHLLESQSDVELASLWLLDPHRLTRFYQLRCAANLTSCEREEDVRAWFLRGHYSSDMHQKTTALCHYLAVNGGGKEAHRIESELKKATADPILLQLSTCVRDNPKLAETAAKIVVAQRNAAVYDSVLRSDLSQQHYNFEFRRSLWKSIGFLSETDRRFLFSVDEIVKSLLPSWGRIGIHLQFLNRLLSWQDRVSTGVLSKFFSSDSPSL